MPAENIGIASISLYLKRFARSPDLNTQFFSLAYARREYRNRFNLSVPEAFCTLSRNRDMVSTVFAIVLVIKVPPCNCKTISFDCYFAASRTIGVIIGIPGDISNIHVIQTRLLCNFVVFFKELVRSWRNA